MIKLEHTEVVGWKAAVRGMRNPMNSWEKSNSDFACPCKEKMDADDTRFPYCLEDYKYDLSIGPNDLALMMKLRNAGTDHRKFMRMIVVYVDITAPLYWWKEFDTYKVGTVANSCSTMHKIADKEFVMEDFSTEHLIESSIPGFEALITYLNAVRDLYLENKEKDIWWQMIQLLPSSYNQKRTVMMSYEVLANIYKSRKNHKLDEWSVGFIDWIETLPYSELITGEDIA